MTYTCGCANCDYKGGTRVGTPPLPYASDPGIMGPFFCSVECQQQWLESITDELDFHTKMQQSRDWWGYYSLTFIETDISTHDMSALITFRFNDDGSPGPVVHSAYEPAAA